MHCAQKTKKPKWLIVWCPVSGFTLFYHQDIDSSHHGDPKKVGVVGLSNHIQFSELWGLKKVGIMFIPPKWKDLEARVMQSQPQYRDPKRQWLCSHIGPSPIWGPRERRVNATHVQTSTLWKPKKGGVMYSDPNTMGTPRRQGVCNHIDSFALWEPQEGSGKGGGLFEF